VSRFRKLFLGMMLVSGAFVATACGPQSQPEQAEPAPTTESATAELRCNQPGRKYVSRDPVECLSITWSCGEGEQQFLDDCGCGCQ
jgi:hypothetical protein